ncbi:MAG: SMC-Scp complex subunit ScpB [Actinobacteria bacterium]|nr:SMC-Scp complex subunit ScpB [Actinomycetota bacterium]
MSNIEETRRALEAILFVCDEPISSNVLAQAVEVRRTEVEAILRGLAEELDARGAGIVLREVAGGWRLATHPEAAAHVEQFVLANRQARLSKAALETLAIVAYKQPVTRHQVSSIRGVNSDAVLRALQDRGLIAEVGRDEGPGRAVLYGTTDAFLERLGLASTGDLPPIAPLLGEAAQDVTMTIPERSAPSRPAGPGAAAETG